MCFMLFSLDAKELHVYMRELCKNQDVDIIGVQITPFINIASLILIIL